MDIRDIPPPRRGEPIYDFLARHLTASRGLADLTLPDERSRSTDRLRWAPGGMDRVLSEHTRIKQRHEHVRRILHLVVRAATRRSRRSLRRLHQALLEGFAPEYLDDLLEAIVEGFVLQSLQPVEVRDLGWWLATRGTHRNPVKVGIALMGVTRVDDARDVLLTLGRHDEFSLHVAAALVNGDSRPEASLWELAREVDGWGRIYAVERLSGSEDPAIQAWLLRYGFRNTIAAEFLAYTAAVTGNLGAALERHDIDEPLLRGGRDIVRALLTDYSPTFDIDNYDRAADTVANLLRHLRDRACELEDFLAVDAIRGYLEDPEADWDERYTRGWTVARRVWMEEVCGQILSRPVWRDLVEQGLGQESGLGAGAVLEQERSWPVQDRDKMNSRPRQAVPKTAGVTSLESDDDAAFHAADEVARKLGIETFDAHLRHLRAKPLDQNSWLRAMQDCSPQRIDELVLLAEEKLPLDEIATGPSDSAGVGCDYAAHRCLGVIAQELERFSGKGWRLIATGLRSPVVWNRNMALRALAAWDRRDWPAEARPLLKVARKKEPTDWTAKEIGRLLLDTRPHWIRRWATRPSGTSTSRQLSV